MREIHFWDVCTGCMWLTSFTLEKALAMKNPCVTGVTWSEMLLSTTDFDEIRLIEEPCGQLVLTGDNNFVLLNMEIVSDIGHRNGTYYFTIACDVE